MKKLMVAMMMLAIASSALAAPLAQTAEPIEVGQINAAVMIDKGMGDYNGSDGFDLFGFSARATYGAIENLAASVEVGYTMTDAKDEDGDDISYIPLALAVQYSLPVDWPVDVAVRGVFEIGDMGEASDTMSLLPGAVISWNCTQVEWLALYAGVGYWLPINLPEETKDLIDGGLALAFGADFDLASVTENLGALVEVNMVDMGIKNVDMMDAMNVVVGATYAF